MCNIQTIIITCVEQWYYNVDYQADNNRCNIDGALNNVAGNIHMIVYKVDRPRSGNTTNLIDGEPQKTSKPYPKALVRLIPAY